MTETKSFLAEIPEETKRLLELKFVIYTDGSCDDKGNGGWAAYIIDNRNRKTTLKGSAQNTTNNRMEMTAIIEAFEFVYAKFDDNVKPYVCIELYSDSTYCTNTLKEWIHAWVKTEFAKRPNSDLLKKVYDYVFKYEKNLTITWLPRNSTEQLTLCDQIANQMRTTIQV